VHRALFVSLGVSLGATLASCERSGAASGHHEVSAPDPAGERAGIPLPGDCRGAWWDAAAGSLFLTDVTHDELIRWREGEGFATVAKLPPASSLGGVVRTPDGRFVIASFGFGEGAIYIVEDGRTRPLGGLDPGRRRTALALAPDGAVYAAYFEIAAGGTPRGGVSRLLLAGQSGGELDLAVADLRKPVGLAATGAALYVADQHRAALHVLPLGGAASGAAPGATAGAAGAAGPAAAIIRELPSPELVVALPGGELIVATRAGAVLRVPARGPAIQLAQGFGELRGLAYDAAGARLFLVEHRAAAARHLLHVLPATAPASRPPGAP
jgi:hypothetical protein